MSKKVLIYQDLVRDLPFLRDALRGARVHLVVVTGAKDVLDKTTKLSPDVVLLPATLGSSQGIEIAREIFNQSKETRVFVLVKEGGALPPSPQCDLVVLGGEAQKILGEKILPLVDGDLAQFLSKLQNQNPMMEKREHERIDLGGKVKFEYQSKPHVLEVKNMSLGGVLILSPFEIELGEKLSVELISNHGNKIETVLEVVRCHQYDDSKYAWGSKFSQESEALRVQVYNWVSGVSEGEPQKTMHPSTESRDQTQLRGNERLNVVSDVVFTLDRSEGAVEHQGRTLNISRTGILVAVKIELEEGKLLHLRIPMPEGTSVFNAITARTTKYNDPSKTFLYAVGAKWHNVESSDISNLEAWILKNKLSEQRKSISFSSQEVLGLLSVVWAKAEPVLMDSKKNLGKFFLADISGFEREAIKEKNIYASIVEKALFEKFKFEVLEFSLPKILAEGFESFQRFGPKISELIEKSIAIDLELDEWVKKSLDQGEDTLKLSFNDLSNRFFNAKKKCLFALVEAFKDQPEKNNLPWHAQAEAFVQAQKQMFERVGSQVLFEKKKKPEPVKKIEESKKGKKKKSSVGLWVMAGTLGVMVGGGILWGKLSSMVSKEALGITFPVIKSNKDDDNGLILKVNRQEWLKLSESEMLQQLKPLEIYMDKNYLMQTKIVDENGALLVTMAIVVKKKDAPSEFGYRFKK